MNTPAACRAHQASSQASFRFDARFIIVPFDWQRTPSIKHQFETFSQYSDCSVIDPIYEFTFNLSSLAIEEGYVLQNDDNENAFKFNVCGKVKDCDGGICAWDKSSNNWKKFGGGTMYSQALYYSDGIAHLTYIGTGVCEEYEVTQTTRIEFRCSHNSEEKWSIRHDSECELVIDFPTSLMCHKIQEIPCQFTSEELKSSFDLSPLSRSSDNYIVDHFDENGLAHKYILNMCRNIVHQKGVICPPNSAACEKFGNKTSHEMQFIDLGQFKEDDDSEDQFKVNVFDKNQNSYEIELKLETKEPCPKDSLKKRLTLIKLLCDPSGLVTDHFNVSTRVCGTNPSWSWSDLVLVLLPSRRPGIEITKMLPYEKQLFLSRLLSAMMVVLSHFCGKLFTLVLPIKSATTVINNMEVAKQRTQLQITYLIFQQSNKPVSLKEISNTILPFVSMMTTVRMALRLVSHTRTNHQSLLAKCPMTSSTQMVDCR